MTNGIPSDSFLTKEQSCNLKLLLNMIIPPNKEKGMPGAGELGFVHYVREFASDQIEAIKSELDMLGQESQDQYNSTFADLSQNEREFLVDLQRKKNAQFAQSIVVQTMACYYQDDKVMIALGIEARPPFPKGNEVTSGDLSLLNPVRERKQIYRDV
jgi:hypothetical protein|tara:strand:+ start:44 stop:514 length:471 start_codon:yes stop_codon:yes gene_type:complete